MMVYLLDRKLYYIILEGI